MLQVRANRVCTCTAFFVSKLVGEIRPYFLLMPKYSWNESTTSSGDGRLTHKSTGRFHEASSGPEAFTGLEKSFLCKSQNFSGRAWVPFFWSHFLSSWSQSCAKTQLHKFSRKKRTYLWGKLLHTPEHEHHQWNDSKLLSFFWQWKSIKSKKRKEKKDYKKKLGKLHSHEARKGRGRIRWVKAD